MTLIGALVVLIRVSLILSIPIARGLLIPITTARLQAKEVPTVTLVGVYENNVLLHIAGGVSELDRFGVGLTVTTTFWVLEQPVAVKVYT